MWCCIDNEDNANAVVLTMKTMTMNLFWLLHQIGYFSYDVINLTTVFCPSLAPFGDRIWRPYSVHGDHRNHHHQAVK